MGHACYLVQSVSQQSTKFNKKLNIENIELKRIRTLVTFFQR
jgi:hypothetical protein